MLRAGGISFKFNINKKIVTTYVLLILIISVFFGNFFINDLKENGTVLADSNWTQTSDYDFINGTLNNITISGMGSSAELKLKSNYNWINRIPVNRPIGSWLSEMAAINDKDEVLLFGGDCGYSLDETWIYNHSQNKWIKKLPIAKPKGRSEHYLKSICGTDKVLLFSGYDMHGAHIDEFDDTWIYDLSDNNWTNKNPSINPGYRRRSALASIWGYDKALLYGGYYKGNSLDDTWVYDLSNNTWTNKKPKNKPGFSSSHALSSIYGTDKVLFFGGGVKGETWVYDLSENTWTNKSPANRSDNMYAHKMTYVYGTDKVVLFGGCYGSQLKLFDTWVYDLSDNKWTKKNTFNMPSPRSGYAMASIQKKDKVVIWGGSDYDSVIWEYDLSENIWLNKSELVAPYRRLSPSMASVFNDDKVVLFGGYFWSIDYCDTWVYDISEDKWSLKVHKIKPKPRHSHEMTPIYGTDKILLFGGVDNETWIYDLSENKWINKTSSKSPPTRVCFGMTPIFGTDKVVIFGGRYSYTLFNDTWVYDLSENSWTNKTLEMSSSERNISAICPSARQSHSFASIYNDDKVVLFGGYEGNYDNETWVYDLSENKWTNKSPVNHPNEGSNHDMDMLYYTDKVVLYGNGYHNDGTWFYDLSDNNWTFKAQKIKPKLYDWYVMVPKFKNGDIILMHEDVDHAWTYNYSKNIWTFQFYQDKPSSWSNNNLVPIYGTDEVALINSGAINWIYNYTKNSWTKRSSHCLPSITSYSFTSIFRTDKIFAFGGHNSSGYINETWVYDIGENLWIEKFPKNNPSRRDAYSMTAIYGTDKVILFGGKDWDTWEYKLDTWVYDLSDNNWMQKTPKNKPSDGYGGYMAPIYGTMKVLLLTSSKETWVYDLNNNTWDNMNPSGDKINQHFSYIMCFIYNDDKVLIYGGPYDDQDKKPITYIYDLSDNTWKRYETTNKPGYLIGQTIAPIFGTKHIIHFGGHDDNTWIFYFNTFENGTFISSPYYIGSNASFKILEWKVTVNKYTKIKFQLRTSHSKDNLKSSNFIGPDGTSSTYYTSSPSIIWLGHNNDTWIQAKAFLITTNYNKTPILKNFTIKYNCYPKLVIQPILPSSGNITTEFNFTVCYFDNDNDKPLFIKLKIDNNNYTMKSNISGDIIYSDGKIYWYTTKLNAGNHTFQFFASDGDLDCETRIINLSVDVGPLNNIIVEPISVTIGIDDYVLFNASGYDIDNNTLSISPIWSVNGGGKINQIGNFTAKTPGSWVVYANYSDISGNAIINIVDDKKDKYPEDKNQSKPDVNGSKNDSDNDGMPDDWEKKFGLNITDPSDAQLDIDKDNLTNLEEFLNMTDPTNPDTDNDTLLDGDEIKIFKTDPLDPDSDTDGQNDGEEIENETNPLDEDEFTKEDNNKDSEQKNGYLIYIVLGVIITIILIISVFYLMVKWKKK